MCRACRLPPRLCPLPARLPQKWLPVGQQAQTSTSPTFMPRPNAPTLLEHSSCCAVFAGHNRGRARFQARRRRRAPPPRNASLLQPILASRLRTSVQLQPYCLAPRQGRTVADGALTTSPHDLAPTTSRSLTKLGLADGREILELQTLPLLGDLLSAACDRSPPVPSSTWSIQSARSSDQLASVSRKGQFGPPTPALRRLHIRPDQIRLARHRRRGALWLFRGSGLGRARAHCIPGGSAHVPRTAQMHRRQLIQR